MTEETEITDFGDYDPYDMGDIFENRDLVRIGHIPRREKIIGRDEEIQFVGSSLGPAINGGPPENITIHGKTGTGKSLVSRFMVEEAERRAEHNGVKLIHVYFDCSDLRSSTETAYEIASSVKRRLDADISIPAKGISRQKYFKRLWKMLDDHEVDTLIVILDEIDKLDSENSREDDDDDVLMALSRAEEKRLTDTYIGIVCVSNKIGWRREVDERVDSSLSDRKTVFNPYNANDIRKILKARTDAFREGVLDQEVIPKISALAAKEHGDARKAVDMLRYAGRIAERNGEDVVRIEHLDEAKLEAEADQFEELITGSTPHAKYILRALAEVTLSNNVRPDSRTGGYSKEEIYSAYKRVCEEEMSDPIKWDSVSRLLREQSFLGVTESQHTSSGRGQGSYKTHELIRDPDIVLKALE